MTTRGKVATDLTQWSRIGGGAWAQRMIGMLCFWGLLGPNDSQRAKIIAKENKDVCIQEVCFERFSSRPEVVASAMPGFGNLAIHGLTCNTSWRVCLRGDSP